MNKLNATAFVVILFTVILFSCKKNPAEQIYSSSATLTSGNVVPAVTTTATGNFVGTYNSRTKTLNYTISWSGLQFPADSIRAIHIHGLAGASTNAVSAPFGMYPSSGTYQGVAQNITVAAADQKPAGSISSSLFVDGVVVREEDLLAGQFYIDIHTKSYPGGQLRGQIIFQ